jgi:hypothetical protein
MLLSESVIIKIKARGEIPFLLEATRAARAKKIEPAATGGGGIHQREER